MLLTKSLLSLGGVLFAATLAGQCTPTDCLASLPPFGGICETEIADAIVNQPYTDAISFHITTECVDGALLGEEYAGTSYKVTSLHSFEFLNLPLGLTAETNQAVYTAPANGCAAVFGVPSEAGVFTVTVSFMINVNVWLLSSSCGGFFPPVAQNDNVVTADLNFEILPDASFTGIAENELFCLSDNGVQLIALGTQGGVFSGEGVSGTMFEPSLAGPGVHVISYTVSAQEGDAVAPATASSSIVIEVLGSQASENGNFLCPQAGCTDPIAANFDQGANEDDGSCIYLGCTDSTAINYNPLANEDNGTCLFPGCTDAEATNFDPVANVDDGSCLIGGCMTSFACNYNPEALIDDGSCENISCAGCTYLVAINYNPSALIDDGSCVFPVENFECVVNAGCTYSFAVNFDPMALCDNGSCQFECVFDCIADLNQDGVVNSSDLAIFLGSYGILCSD